MYQMEMDAEQEDGHLSNDDVGLDCDRCVLILILNQLKLDLGGGIHGQLERLFSSMARLHQAFLAHQRSTDARLIALDQHVRDLQTVGVTREDEPAQGTSRPARQIGKDSSANYLRVSVCWSWCRQTEPYQGQIIAMLEKTCQTYFWLQQHRRFA